MRKEPLKGKERELSHTKLPFYHKEDIKSAVEWLKKKIKEDYFDELHCEDDYFNLIDEAFEDVKYHGKKNTRNNN